MAYIKLTPIPRPYAQTLEERTFIYQPNPIQGNKPINIGHPYSILSVLPERTDGQPAPWCIPLSAQRVLPTQKGTEVGSAQLSNALSNLQFPQDSLSVLVADSDYSTPAFLNENLGQDNIVIVTRVRSNRVFYLQPNPCEIKTCRRGHPRWYGNKFDLKDETTWTSPNELVQTQLTTRSGRELMVTLRCWRQILMRGTSSHPFGLHSIVGSTRIIAAPSPSLGALSTNQCQSPHHPFSSTKRLDANNCPDWHTGGIS